MDVYTPPFLTDDDLNQSGMKRKFLDYDDGGQESGKFMARKSSFDMDDDDSNSTINRSHLSENNYAPTPPPNKRLHMAADLEDIGPRELSDHLKDMCNCQCGVCGKIFVHHRMLKHIERTHKLPAKDKFIFLKISNYRCKLCPAEMLFSFYTIGQHARSRHQMTLQQYRDTVPGAFQGDCMIDQSIEECGNLPLAEGEERVITDNLVNMCQVKCFVCDQRMYLNSLKRHLQKEHEDQDTDFPTKIEFINRSYYACKMCNEVVLFHFDAINKHLSVVHNSTMHTYKNTYTAFTGDKEYKAYIKAQDKEKAKQMRLARQDPSSTPTTPMAKLVSKTPTPKPHKPRGKGRNKFCMDEEEIARWSITLNNTVRYYSNNPAEMCVRQCRVCGEIMFADQLKSHIYVNHRGIKENTSSMDYIRLTYHKCKACGKDLKFTANSITKHTKRSHDVNYKEYVEKYNPFDQEVCNLDAGGQPKSTGSTPKSAKKKKAKDVFATNDPNKDTTNEIQQGQNNYLTTINTNIAKENIGEYVPNNAYGFNSPIGDQERYNNTVILQSNNQYQPQQPSGVYYQQSQQQTFIPQHPAGFLPSMRPNQHIGNSSPSYPQNQYIQPMSPIPSNARASPHHQLMSPGGSIHQQNSQQPMMAVQFVQHPQSSKAPQLTAYCSPHFVLVQEPPQVKQEPDNPQHSQQHIGSYTPANSLSHNYQIQSGGVLKSMLTNNQPNTNPYHYVNNVQNQSNRIGGLLLETVTKLEPTTGLPQNQVKQEPTYNSYQPTAPNPNNYNNGQFEPQIKTEPGLPQQPLGGGGQYTGHFQVVEQQVGPGGTTMGCLAATVKTEPGVQEEKIDYLGLKPAEPLSSSLLPITKPLSPIHTAIKSELSPPQNTGEDATLSPLAGLDDDAWYDGNTFQCLQCGFISRSLENLTVHMNDYHNQSPPDFQNSVSRTNIMYRCKLCHQEVYHEKSAINGHITFHSLDLQLYASIYEHPNVIF